MKRIILNDEVYEIEEQDFYENLRILFEDLGMQIYKIFECENNILKIIVAEDDIDELTKLYIKLI